MRFADIQINKTYYAKQRYFSGSRTFETDYYVPYYVVGFKHRNVIASANGAPAREYNLNHYKNWLKEKPEDDGVRKPRANNKRVRQTREHKIPAFPPEDYKGSQADWMIKLQQKGFWDGVNPDWYGDVLLDASDWWELLEECEK